MKGSSIVDRVYPICITFADSGRMFVGDSKGTISVWDISQRHGNLYSDNHFKITSKEIDGDEINEIRIHPEAVN